MKKGILLCLAFLAGFAVFSQDYQCIRDNATYFYSDGTNIKAIQIDSVVSSAEGLVYYNYPTLGGESYDCLSQFWPSWIGRSVLVKPDGDNVFFNKNNEPITIRTIAELDEDWICYQFLNGNYIRAVIAEIQEMDFLGLNNMVKKITFQAYNSTGTPITHDINSKYLLLSKDFGLIRAINFKVFPDLSDSFSSDICIEFTLAGISNPAVGLQNINRADAFNIDEGDEIHQLWSYNAWGSGYYHHIFSKVFYLQKSLSVNEDTVYFQTYRCGIDEQLIPYEGLVYDYFKDTVNQVFYIGDDSIVAALPDQVIVVKEDPNYWFYYLISADYYESSGKMRKAIQFPFYSDFPHDCIYYFEESEYREYFIDGLGRYYSDIIAGSGAEQSEPDYFLKGSEEWGTPHNFICDTLQTGIDQPVLTSVGLFPNPMHEHSRLTTDNPENKEYQFQLFNSIGVLVKEYHFHTNDLMIQRENLGNGIYFYLLSDEQKVIQSGKLIIR
jgi:hypothetical protein